MSTHSARKSYLYLSALIVVLSGLAAVFGYWTKNAVLVQILHGTVPMAFNAGLAFIFSAIALASSESKSRFVSVVFALLAIVLPALTLTEYLSGLDFGIDQIFAQQFVVVETAHPGRMAPQTVCCFLLFNAGVIVLAFRRESALSQFIATAIGMIITLVGALAFLGYLFDVESLYGWGYFPRMAINTAVCFCFLGSAALTMAYSRIEGGELDLSLLRRRLFGYSILGTTFVALFSSNAGLLPAFSQLEDSARSGVKSSAVSKSLIVEQWAEGLQAVLAQISSRTVIRQKFEDHQRGNLSEAALQQAVSSDFSDGLAANVQVSGVCRAIDGSHCVITAGVPVPAEVLAEIFSAKSPNFSGPYEVGNELQLVGRVPVHAQNGSVIANDLYLIRMDSLASALTAQISQKLPSETFIGFPNPAGEEVFRVSDRHFQKISELAPEFKEILTDDSQHLSGFIQTDVSLKHQLLLGYAKPPLLNWIIVDGMNPELFYAGTHAQMAEALILVGLVVLLGGIGIFFLLKPLEQEIFIHANTLGQKIRDRTLELQRSMEFKSQFLANMSHEIRTPLTAILGFTAQLRDPDISPSTANDSLMAIWRNGHHLLRLINDILDMSKIDAGKLEIEKIECSPVEIVQEVFALTQSTAIEKELTLQIDYVFPLPQTIFSDPTRIRQILLNLISNGIKFTASGHVSVKMEWLRDRNALLIKVEDTGMGMDSEQLSRIFTVFNQGDASTARRFGGTGLGLTITRELTSLLGGTIQFQSTVGIGSSFTVELPMSEFPNTLLYSAPSIADAVPAAKIAPIPSLVGTVLLVEDSEDIRSMVTYLVKRTGAAIEAVPNGEVAVAVASAKPFDLILMDMQMPVMDGYTATRELRRIGYIRPILGLTANTINNGLVNCIEAGCDDALGKPFERGDFFEKLKKYLSTQPPIAPESEAVDASPEVAAIRKRFLQKLPQRLAEIEGWSQTADWINIREEAHRLAGAGLLGFSDIAKAGQELERVAAAGSEVEIFAQVEALLKLCSQKIAAQKIGESR